MNNQQVPKADSKFQKIVRANHKKWKLRLLSKGGQKSDSGGGPYIEKPDYKMGKSAPDMLEEERIDEVIRKKGDKYCLFSKKTKRNLGCYSSKTEAMRREKQVQYFKHLKEKIIKEEIEKALLEEELWDDVKDKGSEVYNQVTDFLKKKYDDIFSSSDEKLFKKTKPSLEAKEIADKYNVDPKNDLMLNRKELQEKFGGFRGYIEFLWKMFDENKSFLSGWSRYKTIELIKQIAPKYGIQPYIVIGTMMGESGGMPVGIYSQTMSLKGNPQAAISANSTAYGMGQIVHSTYESVKNQIGVPHYMIWIPKYGIEATIALISKLIKQKGSLEAAMVSYAGSPGGGERKLAAIEKAKEQYGSLAESKKKGKDDRCVRIAKRKYKAWPSAYASGAVVKCRQGKIWKGVSEGTEELEEEWSEKYKRSIDCKHPKGFSQKAHCQGRKKNEEIQLNEKCWEGYTQKGMKTMFGKKYPNCVKKTNEEVELEERKLGKPSSETNLGDWFKRKGAPGKKGGWVDCNTCRDGKCKPCGRQSGEKRSKYPRCRPTPSQCKGYKRRGSNLQKEEQ